MVAVSIFFRKQAQQSASIAEDLVHYYIKPTCRPFPAGPARWFLQVGTGGLGLNELEGRIFWACRTSPRSLDAHASHASRICGCSATQATATVSMLVSAGVLAPVGMQSVAGSGSAKRSARTPIVVVVTRDRSVALRRCLDSIAAVSVRSAEPVSVLVIDGSADAGVAEENRQATRRAMSSSCGTCCIKYFGADESASQRQAWISVAGKDLEALTLVPGSIGANRNLALLLSAGRSTVFVDDDVVVRTWSGQRLSGVALGGHFDPREWRFFGTREEAISAVDNVRETDVLEEHARYLGADLGSVVASVGGAVDVERGCGHMIEALETASEHRVRVTLAGVAGDGTRHCPYAVLFDTGPLRKSLLAAQVTYDEALRFRNVACVVPRPTVGHDRSCMAYCMGVDNSEFLPPFMPGIRNEDGLFGSLLGLVDPSSLFMHLPFGIIHDSTRDNDYDRTKMPSASNLRISEVLQILLGVVEPSFVAPEPEARCSRFGQWLLEFGTMPMSRCASLMRTLVVADVAMRLSSVAALLDDKSLPTYFRDDAKRYEQALRASTHDPAFFVPIECRGESVERGVKRLQQLCRTFGTLLEAWPSLWSVARREVEFELQAHRVR